VLIQRPKEKGVGNGKDAPAEYSYSEKGAPCRRVGEKILGVHRFRQIPRGRIANTSRLGKRRPARKGLQSATEAAKVQPRTKSVPARGERADPREKNSGKKTPGGAGVGKKKVATGAAE